MILGIYINIDYTILRANNTNETYYINVTIAENYCQNNFGTFLASFSSDIDANSYLDLASIYNLQNETSWIGAAKYFVTVKHKKQTLTGQHA